MRRRNLRPFVFIPFLFLSLIFVILVFYTSRNHVSLSTGIKYRIHDTYQHESSLRIGSGDVNKEIQSIVNYDNVMEHRRDTAPNLYSISRTLPHWLVEYFVWHDVQRTKPSSKNKFLILTCHTHQTCGGLARRLGGLPYFLYLAEATDRILLIHWTKPVQLTEFLNPPKGGINWTIPKDIDPEKDGTNIDTKTCEGYSLSKYSQCLKNILERKESVITVTPSLSLKSYVKYFEKNGLDKTLDLNQEIDGEIFRIFFELSPPLATRMDETMIKLNLIPGEYVSVHHRASYPTEMAEDEYKWNSPSDYDNGEQLVLTVGNHTQITQETELITHVALQAVKCGALLLMNSDVYFASDSIVLVKALIKQSIYSRNFGIWWETDLREDFRYDKNVHPIHLVSRQFKVTQENLHLDFKGFIGRPASDFYSVFEDLFVMASGRCVSYGVGDYGLLAARLTGNKNSCSWKHQKNNGYPNGFCMLDPR